MSYLDVFCLWVGYCICALALLRAAIESIWTTHRTIRRAIRWMGKRGTLNVIIAAQSVQQRKSP